MGIVDRQKDGILEHFRFETSVGERRCDIGTARKHHFIGPGERHFAYNVGNGHRVNICMKCAPGVLDKAESRMRQIMEALRVELMRSANQLEVRAKSAAG